MTCCMLRSFGVYIVAGLAVLVAAAPARGEENETAKEIRRLAPQAASLSKADWEKLTRSGAPRANDFENQPLALALFFVQLPADVQPGGANEADFQFTRKSPRPSDIARAMKPGVLSLVITPLQASYIQDVTADVAGDEAKGTIAFEAKDVYKGKVHYVARRADDKWKIVEFSLPGWKAKTALGDDGKWKFSQEN